MTQLANQFVVGCFEVRANGFTEDPTLSVDEQVEDWNETAKVPVTHKTAQTVSAWWQGITIIGNDVAQLPLFTYRPLEPMGKERAKDHPAYKLLHRRPNSEMGPFRFKHLLTTLCASWGNAYAHIERLGALPVNLWPLRSEAVTPFRVNGEKFFDYIDDNGQRHIIPDIDMFHLAGPGDDGLYGGKSVFKLAADSLSGVMQSQRYATKFYENDAKPGVVLEFPNAIDETTAKNVLKHWYRRHGGVNNVSKPALLDRGGKVSQFAMSNEDAQFVESRQFSITEIARWLNLPPHRLGDLSRATFSNIEQQSIEYVVFSLMAWLMRWQDECNRKLFTEREIDEGYFCEFLVDALLRGDYSSRMDGHAKALEHGIRNLDEVRAIENLNPLPSGIGSQHYFPLNMTPVGEPRTAERPKPAKEAASARDIFAVHLQSELRRAYQRIGKSATRAAGTPGRLQAWLGDNLVRELAKLAVEIEEACGVGKRSSIDLDGSPLVENVGADFRGLVLNELDGPETTLKARIDGLTKRLAADRPAEIVAQLWSD